MYKISVPESLVDLFGNLIRGTVLTQFPCWRPIALTFADKASFLNTNNFLTSPTEIYALLSKLSFDHASKSSGEVLTEIYTVSNSLGVEDIKKQSKFTISGEFSVPIKVIGEHSFQVHYLYSLGRRSNTENMRLIPEDVRTVVFSSAHSLVEDCAWQVIPSETTPGVVSLSFSGDENILKEAVMRIRNIMDAAI
jgi:hypothetical protein